MQTFDAMFRAATGFGPHGYQARIAQSGLPDVVRAPTGTGKTGIILAWLWRQRSDEHKDATPRRLVYALPQRTLVDQVANQARTWLENLKLTDDIALHVVMEAAARARASGVRICTGPRLSSAPWTASCRRRSYAATASAARSFRSTSPWSRTAPTG